MQGSLSFCRRYKSIHIDKAPRKIQKQVNLDLISLYKWLLANKISLNCSKTELIFFHTPSGPAPDLRIKINGLMIHPSSYIKYLGVYLDATLSGNHHCDILVKTLKIANGMLSKVRHYVPRDELVSIYYAIFSSHLIYGCQIWGQNSNIFNDKIFKLQNRAMRIISFADFHANADPFYKMHKVLKLSDFITLQNCILVHDFLNNKLPHCFKTYFKPVSEIHDINTKASELGCLHVPYFATTKYGLNSISRKCIDSWNFFTKKMDLKLLELSRSTLKNKISSYYIESY